MVFSQKIQQIKYQEYKSDMFTGLNGGVDIINDPRQLLPDQCIDCGDLLFYSKGFRRRPGMSILNATDTYGAGKVLAIHTENTGDVLRVFYNGSTTAIQRLAFGGTTWTSLGTVTNSPTTFWHFTQGYGETPTVSATLTVVSASNQYVVVSAGAWSINQYIGQSAYVTSGVGSGQKFMITSHDTTTFYIEGSFDILPAAGDTISVRPISSATFLCNGNTAVYRIIGSSAVTTGLIASRIAWHKNRLWIAYQDKLFFSSLNIGDYAGSQSYIQIGRGTIQMRIAPFGDRITVLADEGRFDVFGSSLDDIQVIKRSEKTTSGSYDAIGLGVNTLFYVSPQGAEMLPMTENSSPSQPIPISLNLTLINTGFPTKFFGDYTLVGVYNNRAYFFAAGTKFGTSATKCYVYDIKESGIAGYPIWSIINLPKTVTAVHFGIDGKFYMAMDGIIVYFNDSVYYDWNNNFSSYYVTPRWTQKDTFRKKEYIKCRDRFVVSQSGTINIYVSYDGGSYTLVKAKTFTGTSTETELEINTFLGKIAKDISFKWEVTWSGTAGKFDSVDHETMFNYIVKPI